MKVAAFGRTQWLYDSIQAIAAQGHEIVLIGTCPAAPEYTITEHDFAALANELKCSYFCDVGINHPQYVEMAKQSGAEMGISVNWLTMIGQAMLDQFRHGIVNAHAGDLPRFRGNAVTNWAILHNETQVVLTLHQMAIELDAGPILLQRTFPLTPKAYIADVYEFLAQNIPPMFVEVVNGLSSAQIVPQEQPIDPSHSLRCFPRLPQDGEIDWSHSAEELARLVRASAEPFGGAYSFLGTEKIIFWRAYPEQLLYPYVGIPGQVVEIRRRSGKVLVLTGDGVLVVTEVETALHGRQKATDLITSSRVRFGMNVTQEILHLQDQVAELKAQVQQLRRHSKDKSDTLHE